jgi:hypothetical protein
LAAVVDRDPDPEGQGGLALAHGLAALVAVLVGGDPVAGVELVEGLLGVAFGVGASDVGVGVAELVAEVLFKSERILIRYRGLSAVRTGVCPGRWRPSEAKGCVLTFPDQRTL